MTLREGGLEYFQRKVKELEEDKKEIVEALAQMLAAFDSYMNEFNPAGKIKSVCDWGLVNEALVNARNLVSQNATDPEDEKYGERPTQ